MQAEHYNGLIAVWKEQGYTSHDVVAKLRGILHQKKIGHTGTLDPQAKGVLAVGLGLGTKTFDLLPENLRGRGNIWCSNRHGGYLGKCFKDT